MVFVDQGESEYEVTFEVKETKVTGRYTCRRNQDDIPGFDVMLKKPVILKESEIVTLSSTIKGPQSCGGKNGLPSVTLKGVSVTFSDYPSLSNGTCINQGQFHDIILGI